MVPNKTDLYIDTSIRYIRTSKINGIITVRLIPKNHIMVAKTDIYIVAQGDKKWKHYFLLYFYFLF